MAVHSSDMIRLLDLIGDRELAEKIKARYYQDVESQTSFVQTRMGEIEIHLDDTLRDTISNTNDMISESIQIGKGTADRMEALHSEVQRGFHNIESRFAEIDARFEQIGTEFDSFRSNIRSEFAATAERTASAVEIVTSRIDLLSSDLTNVKNEIETRRPFFAQIERNSQIIARMAEDFERLKRDMLVDRIGREERIELTEQLRHHSEVMPGIEKDVPELKMSIYNLEDRLDRLESSVREFIELYKQREDITNE